MCCHLSTFSPLEQLQLDYAGRHKAGGTHTPFQILQPFPNSPTISKFQPFQILPQDQAWTPKWRPDPAHGHILPLETRGIVRKKKSTNLSITFPRRCSFCQREPSESLHHHLCIDVFVILDELLVLALRRTQNHIVADTSPSKKTQTKKTPKNHTK